MQPTECRGRIEHKVAGPTQQLPQGANRPCKAQGGSPSHLESAALGDHLVVVTVGAFTGRAHGIESLPRLAAPPHGSDQTRMVPEGHAVARAEPPVSMRAGLALLGGTREAADILPPLGLVVVAIGATQAPTGGRGGAVLIGAARQQRGRIEVLGAPVVGNDRDRAALMQPLVDGRDVRGRVPSLHVARHDRHGQGGAMAHALGARIGARSIGRIAQRSCQRQVGMESGSFEVHVAKDPLFFAWVLGVDMIADTGFEVCGHLRAAGASLTAWTEAEVGPCAAYRRELLVGHAQELGALGMRRRQGLLRRQWFDLA
jgi:hypothetical protein